MKKSKANFMAIALARTSAINSVNIEQISDNAIEF